MSLKKKSESERLIAVTCDTSWVTAGGLKTHRSHAPNKSEIIRPQSQQLTTKNIQKIYRKSVSFPATPYPELPPGESSLLRRAARNDSRKLCVGRQWRVGGEMPLSRAAIAGWISPPLRWCVCEWVGLFQTGCTHHRKKQCYFTSTVDWRASCRTK